MPLEPVTTLPAHPVPGQSALLVDVGLVTYEGGLWLTPPKPLPFTGIPASISANGVLGYASIQGNRRLLIVEWITHFTIGGDNSPTKYWTVKLQKANAAGTVADLAQFDTTAYTDADGMHRISLPTQADQQHVATLLAPLLLATTDYHLLLSAAKTSTPGDLTTLSPIVSVREVID